MTAVAVHACSLERVESLLFAKDPARSRIGDPESFYERVYAERSLDALDDPETAADVLRSLVLGPAPAEPLTRTYAVVLRSILDTVCPRIDDDAFGAMSLADARSFARRLTEDIGPVLAASLDARRLPFLSFEDKVHSPVFSYWTRDEIRRFLAGSDAALELLHGDIDSSDRLRKLQGVWRSAVAQGPDALLVITL